MLSDLGRLLPTRSAPPFPPPPNRSNLLGRIVDDPARAAGFVDRALGLVHDARRQAIAEVGLRSIERLPRRLDDILKLSTPRLSKLLAFLKTTGASAAAPARAARPFTSDRPPPLDPLIPLVLSSERPPAALQRFASPGSEQLL